MNRLDLSRFGKLDLIEVESLEQVYERLALKSELNDLSPANPAARVLRVCSLEIVRQQAAINDLANGLLLTQARGPALDHLAETYFRGNFTSDWKRRAGETDEDYRRRLHQLPNAMSVAGPRTAYETHAAAASDDIQDVFVESPDTCKVVVHVLPKVVFEAPAEGSEDAERIPLTDKIAEFLRLKSDLKTQVADALKDKRPITDKVTVELASIIPWKVNAKIKVRPGPSPELALQQARENLKIFMRDQYALNTDIVESALHRVLSTEGVIEVTLEDWQDLRTTAAEAPYGDFEGSSVELELI